MKYFSPTPAWSTVEEAMSYVLRAKNGLEQLRTERDDLKARQAEITAQIAECQEVLNAAREFVKVTI